MRDESTCAWRIQGFRDGQWSFLYGPTGRVVEFETSLGAKSLLRDLMKKSSHANAGLVLRCVSVADRDSAEEALALATTAHTGQVDKAGEAYINHPRRVAEYVVRAGRRAQVVAYLHDVLEDTHCTVSDLEDAGFSATVIDAVIALTRLDGEDAHSYYSRVKANALARVVKFADIADNSDPARLGLLDDGTAQRLRGKYEKALLALA